jgi:DNA-binding transcriptional MerR regulator
VQDDEPVGIGAAAARLGVTTSTLRSWERRYNLTRPERTTGAHRRYTAADLARLTAMRQLTAHGMPAAQAAALIAPGAGAGSGELAARLRDAADALDPGQVSALLHGALLSYGAAATWDQLLAPLLIDLGSRWHDGGGDIDREHVFSDAAQTVLRSYAQQTLTTRPAGDPVLLLAVPGERHILPLAALAAALAEQATAALLLAELPPADLAHLLATIGFRAAVLWSRTSLGATADALHPVARAGLTVYTAGPGWDGVARPASIPHLATLAAATEALTLERAVSGRRARPPS